MNSGQETAVIPEKEFDKNFKIPKRKLDDSQPEQTEVSPLLSYDNQNVMANSYYNYQYPMGMYGPWQGYYPQYQPGPSQYNLGEPMTQKICSTLMAHKEKPKTYNNNIFKETVPDANDESLPKELTLMFQPLYCKLCSAHLSSNIMAKMHYKSKNHEKKIKKFLVEYAERTGEPMHKRAKTGISKSANEDEDDPKYYHCDVCDLSLTGKLHAESHYMGRNHQKAIMGKKNPAGKGFYNEEGKWVRVKAKKKSDGTGDEFGLAFRPKQPEVPESLPEPSTVNKASTNKFQCDICNVAATCPQQLEMHYKGQKHMKKMKQLGLKVDNECSTNSGDQKSTKIEQDIFSAYRTPSGNYYCQICNITLNSEIQFKVHLSSKNHHKKLNQQK